MDVKRKTFSHFNFRFVFHVICYRSIKMWNTCAHCVLLADVFRNFVWCFVKSLTPAIAAIWLLSWNVVLIRFVCFVAFITEADYTLDDSFWNDESPVGE